MTLRRRWQKAFGRVDLTELLEMLRDIGVNWRKINLIRNSQMGQRAKFCPNQGKSDTVEISDGDVACLPYYLTYMENI